MRDETDNTCATWGDGATRAGGHRIAPVGRICRLGVGGHPGFVGRFGSDGRPDSMVTSLTGFGGGNRPHRPGGRTPNAG